MLNKIKIIVTAIKIIDISTVFDEKFKRQVIESLLSGSVSQGELGLKYTISPLLISRWKKEYKQGKFFENNMNITRFELKLHEL